MNIGKLFHTTMTHNVKRRTLNDELNVSVSWKINKNTCTQFAIFVYTCQMSQLLLWEWCRAYKRTNETAMVYYYWSAFRSNSIVTLINAFECICTILEQKKKKNHFSDHCVYMHCSHSIAANRVKKGNKLNMLHVWKIEKKTCILPLIFLSLDHQAHWILLPLMYNL